MPGKYDQSVVDAFFIKYLFIPYKELVYGYDDDEEKLYITYNVDDVDKLGDMPVTRNIWCFDKKTGERLWVIEAFSCKEATKESGPYGGAYFDSSTGKLKVSGWNCRYDLDPETGKLSNPVFTK